MRSALQAWTAFFHELTAHLQRPQGNVDLMLMVIDRDSAQGLQAPAVYLKLIEGQPMKTGEVTVTAKAISNGLAQNGHIALYGIHFATDSAALEASSDKELGEMAKMLKQEPSAHVYIVGHTDDTGALPHNLKLSRDRADAVVKALITRYGISSNRLVAEGVASFAPVASNASERGRALNRRVEIVLQ
jgi:outer membrane protein OmpA-like peptidoglycan-associated protein